MRGKFGWASLPKIDPKNPLYMGCRRIHIDGFGVSFWKHYRDRGFRFGSILVFWEASRRQARLRMHLGDSRANLAIDTPFQRPPFWFQVGSLSRAQIDSKRCKNPSKNDAPQNRALMRFWWILGWKLEGYWHQIASKIKLSEHVCQRDWGLAR